MNVNDIFEQYEFVIIGERINPTGKRKLREELKKGNMDTLKKMAVNQVNEGANILDVNVGVGGGDELELMQKAIESVQDCVDVPISIDSNSPEVIGAGLNVIKQKPIINSTTGEKAKLEKILPLCKEHETMLIGLTIGDKGLPQSAEDRFDIAKQIVREADKIGIGRENILIDCMTLSVATNPEQALATLTGISKCKENLQVKTVLGISNISYGLPNRSALNSTFLKMAREAGLDAAIIAPAKDWNVYDKLAENVINGKDDYCMEYISKYRGVK